MKTARRNKPPRMIGWILILTLVFSLMADGASATATITKLYINTSFAQMPESGEFVPDYDTLKGNITISHNDNNYWYANDSCFVGWFEAGTENNIAGSSDIENGRLDPYTQFMDGKEYVLVYMAYSGTDLEFSSNFNASSIVYKKNSPYKTVVTNYMIGDTVSKSYKIIKMYHHCKITYPNTVYRIIDFEPAGALAPVIYDGDIPATTVNLDTAQTGTANFSISDVQWSSAGSTEAVSTFISGKKYEVSFVLTAVEEYAEFATTNIDDLKDWIAIGGNTVSNNPDQISIAWKDQGKSIKVTYKPDMAKLVKYLQLNGIETPAAEKKPQTTGFISSTSAITPELKEWQDVDGKPFTNYFEAGKTYTLWLELKLNSGYSFSSVFGKETVDINAGTLVDIATGWQGNGSDAKYARIQFAIPEAPSTTTPPPSITTPPPSITTPPPSITTPPPSITTPPPSTTTPPPATTTPPPATGNYTAPDGNTYNLAGNGTASFQKPNGSVSAVTIPDTITVGGQTVKITAIASKAFYKNTKLRTITIGKNIKTIGKSAFEGCTRLKTVKGGNGLVTIKDKAFKGCKVLVAFTFNTKVTQIGKSAFEGCKKLKTITFKTKKLTKAGIGKNSFKSIYAKPTVKCPKAQKKNYKNWLIKVGKMPSKAQFK